MKIAETVSVTYQFRIKYEHEDDRNLIISKLQNGPITNLRGTGIASDKKAYIYACELVGKGELEGQK